MKIRTGIFAAAMMICALLLCQSDASAQSDPYLGQIAAVAFNYAPYGWITCDGRTLQIAQNQALYALIGTT